MIYSLEGKLVRDYWKYEYDVLEIEGQNIADFILEHVEAGAVIPDRIIPRSAEKTHFGHVRLTLEVVR